MNKIAFLQILSNSKKGYNETFLVRKDGTTDFIGYNVSSYDAFKIINVYDKTTVLFLSAVCSPSQFNKTVKTITKALQSDTEND